MTHYKRLLQSTRALLEGVIDYAGLFPPPELSMAEALAAYNRYLSTGEGWMLGRFVVPASSLRELETVLLSSPPARQIPVSALAGSDLMSAVSDVLAFNAHTPYAAVECLETQAGTPEEIQSAASAVPGGVPVFFEIPPAADPDPLVRAITQARGRAKIRTGGLREQAFPSIQVLGRFLQACQQAKIPFKATAGLHHAYAGIHPVNPGSGAVVCSMHGFFNVLAAAAFLDSGATQAEVEALLSETHPNLAITASGIEWGQRTVSTQQIRHLRRNLFLSFGSCSFEDPVRELRALALM